MIQTIPAIYKYLTDNGINNVDRPYENTITIKHRFVHHYVVYINVDKSQIVLTVYPDRRPFSVHCVQKIWNLANPQLFNEILQTIRTLP